MVRYDDAPTPNLGHSICIRNKRGTLYTIRPDRYEYKYKIQDFNRKMSWITSYEESLHFRLYMDEKTSMEDENGEPIV